MSTKPDRRLIHLICIDALRFDAANWHPERRFLQATGQFARHDTPALDSLAEQSARFARCLAPAGYTALSVPCTLTGTYAKTHGVVDFTTTRLRDGVETLCSIVKRAGYRVILHSGKSDVVSMLGLFDDADLTIHDDAELVRVLQQSDQPTFVYSHLNDVHMPYMWLEHGSPEDQAAGFDLYLRLVHNARRADPAEDPPTHFVLADGRRVSLYELCDILPAQTPAEGTAYLRRQLAAYFAGVEKFDRLRFGPLLNGLERIPAWRDGLTILYADHGEAQRPFARWSIDHGATIEENLVRVPLMIRRPGIEPRTISDLVGLIDLLPTVLDYAGLSAALDGLGYKVDGRSLAPCIGGRPHGADAYWLEGWHFADTTLEAPPCVKTRGLRYADGRKYALYGDLVQPEAYEACSEDEFIRYAARHTYATNPTPWFQKRVRDAMRQMSREQIIGQLLGEVRPFRYCANVDQDLLEESTLVLSPSHPQWGDYRPRLDEMLARTGQPSFRPPPDDEDTQQVAERLRALGYVA